MTLYDGDDIECNSLDSSVDSDKYSSSSFDCDKSSFGCEPCNRYEPLSRLPPPNRKPRPVRPPTATRNAEELAALHRQVAVILLEGRERLLDRREKVLYMTLTWIYREGTVGLFGLPAAIDWREVFPRLELDTTNTTKPVLNP